ncbi:MAG: C1 family peptidase, partial [Bacteroidota bacterium]|nr:C1 family peptidase [Bacteroidota bacterium]
YGVCDEKLFPYNESKVKTKPTQACYNDAAPHKIITYLSISTIDQMKLCLADGFPFVGGISIYPSFETVEVAKTGMVPLPKSGERLLGGHAICFVGYDDTKQCFIFRNSWGSSWGDKGFGYLPYVYAQRLLHDCWVIKREM